MSTTARLGRTDREIATELHEKAERITARVPESEIPSALLRAWDWNEYKLHFQVFGGSHAR